MTIKMEQEGIVVGFQVCLRCGRRNPAGVICCLNCGERLFEAKVSDKRGKKHLRNGGLLKPCLEATITESENTAQYELNRIYRGDCLDVIKHISDNSVDLIVTSPPYNFGLDGYDNYLDTKGWQEYFGKLYQIWTQAYRVLKNSGRIAVVVQPLFSDYIPTHHIISQQLRDLGLLFKAEILWEKHNWNCKYTAWGSWKSPSMPYIKYTWEFIEVFCKGDYKKKGHPDRADITADEFKKWVYGKWDIAPETRMKKFDHPSMFPEEIPYRLIRLFSYTGDIVLDPFNGAGTTTLVARKLNRSYIGIDISEKYCGLAEKRIKEYENQAKLL